MTTPIEVTVLWPHPLKKQYPIILWPHPLKKHYSIILWPHPLKKLWDFITHRNVLN